MLGLMEMDPSNPKVLLLSIAGALCIFLLFFRHYRTSGRRKLNLPPGPRPLPIIGNLHILGDLPHRSLQKLSRKYGPIMSLRLGNIPTIVVSSSEAAELILKTHDAIFASRPRVRALEHLSCGNKGFIFAPYGPYWRNMRRMSTAELFSPARSESFAPMRKEEVGRMVEAIMAAAAANEVVDVSAKVGDMIGDMSCRMILGCSTRDNFNLRPIIHEALYLAAAFNISDYVPILESLDLQGFTKRLKSAQVSIETVLEEIISKHEKHALPENKGSFLDILMSMIDQPIHPGGDILERTNIKAILLDLIAASYDALAAVIEWTMSELMRNPRVMSLLQEELETVVGPDRMVEEIDLPKLSYLEMVMKESLRLYPVSPLLLPHESMEDVEIMGYFIPKKSRIIVNAWALGRDEETWSSSNVEEFFPERFLGSDVDVKGHHFCHIPFGTGRRGCPALQIGLTISLFVVAQLVHCFNWEMPEGESPTDLDMSEEFGLDVRRAKHLQLKPSCRRQVQL